MVTAAELYASAIAMEREAAAEYAHLAVRMEELGEEALAELLSAFAGFERDHLRAIERRTAGMSLPPVSPPCFLRMEAEAALTPRQVLGAVLDAERRSQAFFETVVISAMDEAVRSVAREFALEEAEHVAVIKRLLDADPTPVSGLFP